MDEAWEIIDEPEAASEKFTAEMHDGPQGVGVKVVFANGITVLVRPPLTAEMNAIVQVYTESSDTAPLKVKDIPMNYIDARSTDDSLGTLRAHVEFWR